MTHTVEYRSRTTAGADALWAVYADPDGLSRVTDPRDGRVVARSEGAMRAGFEVTVVVTALGVPMRWTSVITEYVPPAHFVDEARSGPFASWRHRHGVETEGGAAWLVDRVEYALPLGSLGDMVAGWFVRRQLDDLFARRHRRIAELAGGAVDGGHGVAR